MQDFVLHMCRISSCVQVTIVVVPQFPYCIEDDCHDMPDSDYPSHVRQAQGSRLPIWLHRHSCFGWMKGQQYLQSQPVAVAVWAGLGGLLINQTVKRQDAVSDALHKRAAETKLVARRLDPDSK